MLPVIGVPGALGRPAVKKIGDVLEGAELAARKRELMARWGPWSRIHHKMIDDPRLRLAAQMAGAPLSDVEAFVVRLEIYARAQEPRGSLADFSVRALAAHWSQASPDRLARIYVALESPEIGWIVQDTLATFHERNPEGADHTNAERQKRHRDLQKAKRENVVHSNGVTPLRVTPDQNREIRGSEPPGGQPAAPASNLAPLSPAARPMAADDGTAAGTAIHSNSGDSGESLSAKEAALVWLATEGRRILVDQHVANRNPTESALANAEKRIERWLRDLDGDAAALASFIKGADDKHLAGAQFLAVIGDALRRHKAPQPSLPLPPPSPHLLNATKRRDSG